MNIFKKYACYYNLLYTDKDYAGETQFVHQLLVKYSPNIQSILDLGCGTGSHALLLAQKGYEVHGVDFSFEMIQQAKAHLPHLPQEQSSRLNFSHGDVRKIRLGRQFDAIISLFHVMSYQVTNDDLKAAFATARNHLKPGGVFIFDCWYGPAVLTNRPSVRIKRLGDEEISVIRIAEPVMHPNENIVDVNYQVFVIQKNNGTVEEFQETHKIRYLFKPEVELLFLQSGFEPVACCEWMNNRDVGFDSWGACFVSRALDLV